MDPLLSDYEDSFVHAVESANALASQATTYSDNPSVWPLPARHGDPHPPQSGILARPRNGPPSRRQRAAG